MKIHRLLLIFICAFGLSLNDSNAQGFASTKDTLPSEKVASVFFDSSSLELVIKNSVDANYLVQVFNMTGTEIFRHQVLKTPLARIRASQLHNGVYLVRITPVPNQPFATFKIMVR